MPSSRTQGFELRGGNRIRPFHPYISILMSWVLGQTSYDTPKHDFFLFCSWASWTP